MHCQLRYIYTSPNYIVRNSINSDLVVFEVPALDLFVLPGREEVRLSGADRESPDSTDVTSESQLQST